MRAEIFLMFRVEVIIFRSCLGDGSAAPSPGGLDLDGSPMPLGSTKPHEPMG
ncbi:MAG: hypothetical protein QXQ57_01945 [Sulfolobales archaeon]